jgi:hypothetical protein
MKKIKTSLLYCVFFTNIKNYIISKPQLYLFRFNLKQNEQVKETLACDFRKSHAPVPLPNEKVPISKKNMQV